MRNFKFKVLFYTVLALLSTVYVVGLLIYEIILHFIRLVSN